eukprot:2155222-Rhodomonas_salina.1
MEARQNNNFLWFLTNRYAKVDMADIRDCHQLLSRLDEAQMRSVHTHTHYPRARAHTHTSSILYPPQLHPALHLVHATIRPA